jgi:hypothetical protein
VDEIQLTILKGHAMNAILSPIVSEFETAEQESSYTKWLQQKTTDSLNDTRTNIPHDQVIGKVRAMLNTKKKAHAAD